MYGIIYCAENVINGKKYIGQTTMGLEKRWACHIYEAQRNKLTMPICSAMRKYGSDKFLVYQISWARNQDELNKQEVFFIEHYNTITSKYGYNARTGGQAGRLTSQARKRMSLARTGNKHWAFGKRRDPVHQAKLTAARRLRGPVSKETREKLSRAGMGHAVSEQTRKKIGEKRKGHTMPPHVKEALRTANKNRPSHRRKGVICVTTNKVFASQREAAAYAEVSFAQMSRLVRGICKHSKGLEFTSCAVPCGT